MCVHSLDCFPSIEQYFMWTLSILSKQALCTLQVHFCTVDFAAGRLSLTAPEKGMITPFLDGKKLLQYELFLFQIEGIMCYHNYSGNDTVRGGLSVKASFSQSTLDSSYHIHYLQEIIRKLIINHVSRIICATCHHTPC